MPTLITRGAASGRGFGLFESGVTTRKETFTSSGSWVCPAGVTSLIYVRGKGQDATGDYPVGAQYRYQLYKSGSGTGSNPAYADWSQLYNPMISDYNTLVTGAIQGGGASTRTAALTVFSNSSWNFSISAPISWSGYYINSKSVNNSGSAQTSGTIVYASVSPAYWEIDFQYVAFGSVGANTTAFGYTFAGGTLSGSYPNQTGNAAAATTYTSVSVTPGTTYNFVVPSGGYVEFAYYT